MSVPEGVQMQIMGNGAAIGNKPWVQRGGLERALPSHTLDYETEMYPKAAKKKNQSISCEEMRRGGRRVYQCHVHGVSKESTGHKRASWKV